MKTLEGKKTILFPFIEKDFEYFFKLFNNGSRHRCYDLVSLGDEETIQEILINYLELKNFEMFLIKTKQGKNSRDVGIFLIEYKNNHIAKLKFLPDSNYIKGLSKYLKGSKISYLEDGLNAILEYLDDKIRIETKIVKSDVLMKQLFKKVSFSKEGNLLKYGNIDDKYFDIVIFSKIKR